MGQIADTYRFTLLKDEYISRVIELALTGCGCCEDKADGFGRRGETP